MNMTTRWGARITDTAKFSLEARNIQFDRVDEILTVLRGLRERAVLYAPPDALIATAPEVPLPKSSFEEEYELKGDSFITDHVWDRETENTFDEIEYDISETWFQSIISAPEGADPSSILEISVAEQNEKTELGHTLLVPWPKSFPAELKAYLDQIDDAKQEAYREYSMISDLSDDTNPSQLDVFTLTVSSTSSTRSSSPTFLHFGQDSTHLSTTYEDFTSFLTGRNPTKYPVTTTQLIHLERFIQDVLRFRHYLSQVLHHVRRSRATRNERWTIHEIDGDVTVLMKSRGQGSPLAEAITADERWPDEWDAGFTAPRRIIHEKYAKANFMEDKFLAEPGRARARTIKW